MVIGSVANGVVAAIREPVIMGKQGSGVWRGRRVEVEIEYI